MKDNTLEKTIVTIEQHKLRQAWDRWVYFHYGIDCDEVTQRFCDFVDPGDENEQVLDFWGTSHQNNEFCEVLPDIADRLNQLTGPHYHAIIKAYYVNHPWK